MFRTTCVALIAVASSSALADYTNNILLTGYWPPTNGMLRPFSSSSTQNPDGWVGGNWESRGYDVMSYFPEFPGGLGQGEGDFEVDYQDTSADWERILAEVRPVAIITFSRANTSNGWELEGGNRMYATSQWSNDYSGELKPGGDLPIMQALAPGTELFSSLPIDEIIADVSDQVPQADPFATVIDNGRFLSNYIGLHGNWYHSMHSDPSDLYRNVAAGHIHVGQGMSESVGTMATEVTLRALIDHVNSIVPAPSGAAVLLAGGLAFSRRTRP